MYTVNLRDSTRPADGVSCSGLLNILNFETSFIFSTIRIIKCSLKLLLRWSYGFHEQFLFVNFKCRPHFTSSPIISESNTFFMKLNISSQNSSFPHIMYICRYMEQCFVETLSKFWNKNQTESGSSRSQRFIKAGLLQNNCKQRVDSKAAVKEWGLEH